MAMAPIFYAYTTNLLAMAALATIAFILGAQPTMIES